LPLRLALSGGFDAGYFWHGAFDGLLNAGAQRHGRHWARAACSDQAQIYGHIFTDANHLAIAAIGL
jgi:hypothetical protein